MTVNTAPGIQVRAHLMCRQVNLPFNYQRVQMQLPSQASFFHKKRNNLRNAAYSVQEEF